MSSLIKITLILLVLTGAICAAPAGKMKMRSSVNSPKSSPLQQSKMSPRSLKEVQPKMKESSPAAATATEALINSENTPANEAAHLKSNNENIKSDNPSLKLAENAKQFNEPEKRTLKRVASVQSPKLKQRRKRSVNTVSSKPSLKGGYNDYVSYDSYGYDDYGYDDYDSYGYDSYGYDDYDDYGYDSYGYDSYGYDDYDDYGYDSYGYDDYDDYGYDSYGYNDYGYDDYYKK